MKKRRKHFRVSSEKVCNSMSGHQMLMAEMLRSSAAIVQGAIRAGYIDTRLRATGKPVEYNSRRSVGGFQPSLIKSRRDIDEEIRFLRSQSALCLLSASGLSEHDIARMVGH